MNGYFTMYSAYPTRLIMPTSHLLDTMSVVRGSHSLQFGAEVYKNRENYFQNWFTGGNLTFRGTASGNAVADYLLGRYDSYRQLTPIINRMRQNLFAVFAQDDWRIHRRLTLNLGFRWDPAGAWDQEDKSLSTFKPGVQSTLFPNAPVGLLYPGDNGLPSSIVGNRYSNFAPRAGFAWDVFGTGRTSAPRRRRNLLRTDGARDQLRPFSADSAVYAGSEFGQRRRRLQYFRRGAV